MNRILVAGIGTEVGKTVASAILTTLLQGEYWKPIECGESDSSTVSKWDCPIHPPAYSLKAPLSPHHAARLENISLKKIVPPKTSRPLIIEGVGGIFVPLSNEKLTFDLFQEWDCKWVIVSKHYLGNINHTLLTLDALQQRKIPLAGIIFNGEPNRESESAILGISKVPLLARLFPEKTINSTTIRSYANQWKTLSGILLHK